MVHTELRAICTTNHIKATACLHRLHMTIQLLQPLAALVSLLFMVVTALLREVSEITAALDLSHLKPLNLLQEAVLLAVSMIRLAVAHPIKVKVSITASKAASRVLERISSHSEMESLPTAQALFYPKLPDQDQPLTLLPVNLVYHLLNRPNKVTEDTRATFNNNMHSTVAKLAASMAVLQVQATKQQAKAIRPANMADMVKALVAIATMATTSSNVADGAPTTDTNLVAIPHVIW